MWEHPLPILAPRVISMEKTKRNQSLLMLTASMAIVGTVGLLRRYIPLSSAALAFARGLIGGLSLLGYTRLFRGGKRERIPGKKRWALMLNGVFLGINWMLLFEAFNHTTIAVATLCYYLQPTIVVLLSPLVFGEKLTAKKLGCAAAALLGMVLVSGVTDGGGAAGARGIAFGLGAAVFYSLVVILNKKIEGVDTYERTVIQLLSAAAAMAPYLLLTEGFSAIRFTPVTVLLVLAAGVVYTGLVYALYFGSMEALSAQTIAHLSYIDPVVALLVSALVLRESLSVRGILGAALILGAAMLGGN